MTGERNPGKGNLILTGASGVLGGALARRVSDAGWRILIHGNRNTDRLAALRDELDGVCDTVSSDLADPEACAALVARALILFENKPDALVHCAGMQDDAPFSSLSDDRFMRVIDVNLSSAMALCKHLARPFARNRGGRVVFIGSWAGIQGRKGGAAYAAAKAGLAGLAKSLAREWASYNVCVNVVLPGFIPGTGMSPPAGTREADAIESAAVLGSQTAGEVADFIVALLESNHISGQILNADSRIPAG